VEVNNHKKKYEIKSNFDSCWVIYDSNRYFVSFPCNNGVGGMDCTINAYWHDNHYNNLCSINSHWSLFSYQVYYLRIELTNIHYIFFHSITNK